jgi:hypothetical protein
MLTAKQLRMASNWNHEALQSFPSIQWKLMTMQVDARKNGMNITAPRYMAATLGAMKAAFGISRKCTWRTFVAHLELFIANSETIHIPTGERAPEPLQMKGGLPPLVQGDEPEGGWSPE